MPQVPRGSVSKRADKDSQRSNWLTTVVTYHQTCYRELTNNLEAKANTLTQGLEPETKTSLNCLEYSRNLRPCSIWDLGLPARPWSTQDLGVPKPWSSRDYGLSQTLVSRSHDWKQLDKIQRWKLYISSTAFNCSSLGFFSSISGSWWVLTSPSRNRAMSSTSCSCFGCFSFKWPSS